MLLAEARSWGQVARLKARALDLPGAEIDVAEKRFYHYPGTAAHALGYVSQVQPQDLLGDNDRMLRRPNAKIGRKGIERTMEKSLRGRAGRWGPRGGCGAAPIGAHRRPASAAVAGRATLWRGRAGTRARAWGVVEAGGGTEHF